MIPPKSERDDQDLGGDWEVSRCACGHLTLRLGALRIEFTAHEFAQLDRLVATAMKRFNVPANEAPVSGRKALTH